MLLVYISDVMLTMIFGVSNIFSIITGSEAYDF